MGRCDSPATPIIILRPASVRLAALISPSGQPSPEPSARGCRATGKAALPRLAPVHRSRKQAAAPQNGSRFRGRKLVSGPFSSVSAVSGHIAAPGAPRPGSGRRGDCVR